MNKLLELRKEKGVRQVDVAEYLNCSYQAYQRYEKGLREPDFATLQKLAEYFGVTVDYILGIAPTKTTDLTEGEKTLLELFNLVPEDRQSLVLEMIKVALQTVK